MKKSPIETRKTCLYNAFDNAKAAFFLKPRFSLARQDSRWSVGEVILAIYSFLMNGLAERKKHEGFSKHRHD